MILVISELQIIRGDLQNRFNSKKDLTRYIVVSLMYLCTHELTQLKSYPDSIKVLDELH